jgi:hypothetical protein
MQLSRSVRSFAANKSARATSGLADFVIQQGGIGHVPVILRNVPEGIALKAERQVNGKWIPLESVDHKVHSYYQAVRNVSGSMDCVFNISRPSTDLAEGWRVRIARSEY